jgi:hypothetical protein
MPLLGASLEDAGGRQTSSEQILGAGADQPTNTDDELPDLIASSSESEEDARGSESSEGQSDPSEETDVVGHVQPLIEWRLMEEAFRRWTRYEYEETSVESDELPDLIHSDSSDFENDSDAGNGEQSAVGSVQGLSMETDPGLRNWYGPCLPDVELIRTVFAAWRWYTHLNRRHGHAADYDGGDDSDDEQDSHEGGDDDPDDKDYPEPFDAGRVITPSGPLSQAGALSCSGKLSEFNAPGGGQDGIIRRNGSSAGRGAP